MLYLVGPEYGLRAEPGMCLVGFGQVFDSVLLYMLSDDFGRILGMCCNADDDWYDWEEG